MKHNNLKKTLEKLGKVTLVEEKIFDTAALGLSGVIRHWRFEMNGRLVTWSEESGCLRMNPYCRTSSQERDRNWYDDCTNGWFPNTIKSIVIWVKNAH